MAAEATYPVEDGRTFMVSGLPAKLARHVKRGDDIRNVGVVTAINWTQRAIVFTFHTGEAFAYEYDERVLLDAETHFDAA